MDPSARPSRRPYDDPDNARQMARDAVACRAAGRLAPGPSSPPPVRRRPPEHRTLPTVSASAARFAARLVD